jgi:small subunit ribosomal protein S9
MAPTKATAAKTTPPASPPVSPSRYFEAVGKRKTAIARVRITKGTGIVVNGKKFDEYFTVKRHVAAVKAPFELSGLEKDFSASAKVVGGGPNAQAEAVRHGIARALTVADQSLKKKLRRAGYLTRDPRMVERKKYGLKKARRAPQWQKR